MNILKQPLLHFLSLGAILFGVYTWLGDPPEMESAQKEIVLTRGRIETLTANFKKVWHREPFKQELDGIIEDFIREEIYYREALGIGLDRNDTIIRRRLRQKMEFITADLSDEIEPTDEELNAYLQENADNYRIEPRLTFRQVYLDQKKRQATLEADTKNLLTKLKTLGNNPNIEELGDRLMLEQRFADSSQSEIVRLFGQDFGAAIGKIEMGQWQGPIKSGYGVHLVYVSKRSESTLPSLAAARNIVERDWQSAKRRESNETFYEALKKNYTITIEQTSSDSETTIIGEVQ